MVSKPNNYRSKQRNTLHILQICEIPAPKSWFSTLAFKSLKSQSETERPTTPHQSPYLQSKQRMQAKQAKHNQAAFVTYFPLPKSVFCQATGSSVRSVSSHEQRHNYHAEQANFINMNTEGNKLIIQCYYTIK